MGNVSRKCIAMHTVCVPLRLYAGVASDADESIAERHRVQHVVIYTQTHILIYKHTY